MRYLISKTNKKFGLIINEFGDIGIDGDLVKSCSKCNELTNHCVVELNNGCLCCTVQDDFLPSIKSLLKSNSNIEAIIIETSGLSLPIPLLQALNWPEIRSSIYLNLVITIVNGESMLSGLPINDLNVLNSQYEKIKKIDHTSNINNLFEEQLEVSDIVLISRSDILSNKDFYFVENIIKKKVNSNVPILKGNYGQVDLNYLFDINIKKNNYKKFISDEHNHEHFELLTEYVKLNFYLEKNEFEKEILNILGDLNILRVKGRLWIPSKSLPLQIQIVGKKINTWFEEAPTNCWKPIPQAGIELVIIAFDEWSINNFIRKIKDNFKVLNDPKPTI